MKQILRITNRNWVLGIMFLLISVQAKATINASFTYTYATTSRCGATLVNFTNTSTSSAPITSTSLFFGDGGSTSSFSPSASRIYSVGVFCPRLIIANSLGERDTFDATPCIQVFANPTINLDIDSASNCNGIVCINNLSNPGPGCTITNVIYDAPGSLEGLVSLPSAARQCFTYTAYGDYSLTVRITNSCGCVATALLTDTITYMPPPIASFTSGPSVGCGTSLSVSFTNTSVGATSYIWRYQRTAPTPGPLTTFSTLANPTASFPAGTYDVTLVAINAAGCRDSITIPSYVVVSSSPTIDFSLIDTITLCGSTSATFRPTTPEVGTYDWTIAPAGGASPSTSSDYTFNTTITASTTYTVTVVQTLPGGCTATRTRNYFIRVNALPSVSYSISGTCHERCRPADTIVYTAFGASCPSGGCTYSWTFPGAVAPTTRTGLGPHTVIYNSFGVFNYGILTVTDSRGCSNTFTFPGQIRITDYTNSITLPNPREGCIPLTLSFLDNTTVNACDSVITRQWSFGTAGSSTIRNPSVTFTTPGCYDVQLITTTRFGCRDTLKFDTIVCVSDTPVLSFVALPDTFCYQDTFVTFAAIGYADSFNWSLGVGGPLFTTRDTVIRSYTDTGVFYPSMIAWVHGCPSEPVFSDTVVVLYPIANFRDSIWCGNRNARYFINISKGIDSVLGVDSVFWDFGVLSSVTDTSSSRNASFIFPDTGCYSVRLTVWSRTTGCDHSITRNICIRRPVLDFTTNTRDTCFGSNIRLTNTSSSTRAGSSTSWYVQGRWFTTLYPLSITTAFNRINRPCTDTIRMMNIATDGCRDTLVRPNYVYLRQVDASISTPNPRIGCAPYNVCFFDTASRIVCGTNKKILWDFGDPSITTDTSTSFAPCYTYTRAGTYNVTATITDSTCSDVSNTITITVVNPIAYFTTDTLHCVNNGPLSITSSSSGYRPTYSWAFPGGIPTTSNLPNPPPVMYNTPGVYTITLTVTDTLGCDSVYSQNVRIYEPIANFGVVDSYFVCDGGLITFYDSSYTNICSWQWDFGDRTGSTLRNPSHIYAQPGMYTVTLIVQSCDGCFDTLTRNNFIVIKGPSGSFTFAPNRICTNSGVRTVISSQNASQIYYLTGDNLITITHPTTYAQDSTVYDTIDYTYTDTGTFTPQILLADSSGCNIAYSPGLTVTVDSLLVRFGFTRVNICDTATICFYDSSLYLVSRLRPTIYDWDFGDGTPHASVANPCHKFNAPGSYRVRLFVYNPAGICGDSTIMMITIPTKPIAQYMRSDSIQCVSDPAVLFTDMSTQGYAPITTWLWQYLPSASTSSLTNPSFDFTASGLYNVKLIITDSLGCRDSISKTVRVFDDPISNAGRDTTICRGFSTRLSGSGAVTYTWSPSTFLSASNVSNPLCTPDSTITYILTATDSAGCSDLDTVTVFVSRVIASFVNDTVCIGATNNFTTTSITNIGTIVGANWNFGDPASGAANTSTLLNPTHIFTSSSTYSVRLVSTNSIGCTDDTIITVPLLTSPISNFSALPICTGDTMRFLDLSTTASGSIVSWLWDFGDLTRTDDTSIASNPTWRYTTAGTYNVRLTSRNQGCPDDTTISVIVWARPIANFRIDTTCIGNAAVYTNLSTSSHGISQNNWNFGDPTVLTDISSLSNPTYTFPLVSPANYNTTLVVTDTNGCTDDTIRTATIVPLPIASFSGDTICPGDTMPFASTSTSAIGGIVRWHWDFGIIASTTDTSNAPNPRFPYLNSGTYNVTLTVYSRYGCMDDTIIPIVVQPPVVANFTMDSACIGDSIHFTDLSVATASTVTAWSWNFSTPPISTIQNPAFLYSTAGPRNVTLRATSSNGCFDDTTRTVYVFANPSARFVADSVCFGDTNTLTSFSTAASFAIVNQLWQLPMGDTTYGNSASVGNLPAGGAYPVTLTVTDAFGCQDDTTMNIISFTLPTSSFTYSGGCGTLPVNFLNTSTAGSGGIINTYYWNFDDRGLTSSIASPSHSFIDTSVHDVLLIVTDVRGCFDSVIVPVTPAIIPDARFTYSPDIEVCLGVPVCFSNASTFVTTPIQSWAWDINGDLLTDYSTADICHTYTAAGLYRVTLTVTDSAGCQDTTSVFVRINQPPVANFSWDTTCQNTPMVFTDLSVAGSGIINSWGWSFGDASGDIIQNPTHSYVDSGTYTVTLMIEDDNGCRDTAVQNVLVDWQSNVSAFSDTSVCQGNSVILHADGAAIYEWTPNLYLDRNDSAYVVSTPNTSINYTVYGYGPYRACPPTTQQITVQVLPAMPFDVTANPEVIILGSTSQLTAFPAGAIDSIIWTPNTTLSCDRCIDPVAEPAVTTTYFATVYYSLLDAYCNTSDSITITVHNSCPKEIFYMPNTFTPNKDGVNDYYYPRGYGVKDILVFRIFDRWGNLVHERLNSKANDKNVGWTGMDKSGMKELNPGVYVYYIEATCTNDDKIEFSGNITLIR